MIPLVDLHNDDALLVKLLQEGLRAAQADTQRFLALLLLQSAEVEHGVTLIIFFPISPDEIQLRRRFA